MIGVTTFTLNQVRMADTLLISICIPTHNRADLLGRTLESIAAVRPCSEARLEVVVIANACTDNTSAVAAEWATRAPFVVRCVDEPKVGLGHGRNRGAIEAKGQVIALADDDIWMAPTWLEATADAYLHRGADLVAGHIQLWWEAVQRPAWLTSTMEVALSKLELGDRPLELKSPDVIGANFSFHRRVFDAVGPFRTDIDRIGDQLLAGGETFFARCALDAGFKLMYIPGASVKHWVSPHRVEEKYMRGVHTGMAMTLAMMTRRLGPVGTLRGLAIGAGKLAYHGAALRVARARGDADAAMRHLTSAALGRGRVLGTIARARRGPLTRPGPLSGAAANR
jgi:glycosyltransferase involved in cell wall biosynthesis